MKTELPISVLLKYQLLQQGERNSDHHRPGAIKNKIQGEKKRAIVAQ